MKGNEGTPGKPIYKKWWFWVIVIIIFGGAGGALDKDKDEAAPAPTEQAVTQPKDEKGGVPEETADATPEPAVPAEEAPVAEKPTAEAPAEKPAAEPAAAPATASDWQAEIAKIASSSDAAPDKASAVEALAMKYKPDDSELKDFENYIVSEFDSGNYLTGLKDDEYALTNIFKSLTVQRQYKDRSESAIGDFAFDFYQNSKYVYRGVDTPDSDAVKSNEDQMNKALAKIK